MSVKKRVDNVFEEVKDSYWNHYAYLAYRKSLSPKMKFRPRVAELRNLEGIYDNPSYPDFPIHISCRFNDILRCSDTKHFHSCFNPEGSENKQPFLRCVSPNWALIFVTDKAGKVMGRTWISFHSIKALYNFYGSSRYNKDEYWLYRLYGNKLGESDVYRIVEEKLLSLYVNGQTGDFKLRGGQPDSYIAY